MKSISKFFLITAFFFSTMVSMANAAEKAPRDLLFGSVAMDIPAVMYKRLTPLTNYLTEYLGRPVSLKLAPNMGVAIKETAEGKVDLAYLTPVAYIKAHKKGNARLIAKTVTKGKASFRLMIVVKQDSKITKVNQLKGASFAFGDKRALLQRAAVVGAGMPLEKLGEYKFIGHYDNIVRAVINGDFDAGILKDTMAYKWEGKGVRILYATPDLPPYNIAASSKVSKNLLKKLRRAFLELDPKDPDQLAVIKAVDKKYDGFAATSDAEYDVVRELIKPFNK